jgi:methionyl-tRNA formyltransferase
LESGLPILQPEKARDPVFVEQLRALAPELVVVAAFGQLLPPSILELPRHGCLNVHASLLPRWRGAAPIQWAMLEGDAETGVTIMKIDAGLDTGDMLTFARTPITPADNSQTLHDRLAEMGAELLVRTIPDYLAGKLTPIRQPAEGVTYARKLNKEDGRLDWTLPAQQLHRRVRAFTPWPGAFTQWGDPPKMLKVWETEIRPATGPNPGEILAADKEGILVACGHDALLIKTLQKEGGRRLTAQEFLAGHGLSPATKLA